MFNAGPNSILAHVMRSGMFSDLMFVCNHEEFRVHKVIVCGHSPMINAAVTGGFVESRSNVIAMHNFKPDTVRRLVQFMYMGFYDVGNNDCWGGNALFFILEHVQVNAIGDYYGITNLVSFANSKIKRLLQTNFEYEFWANSFPVVIAAALESTGDRELLDMLAMAVTAKMSILVQSPSFQRLNAMPEFSIKILQGCAQRISALEQRLQEMEMRFGSECGRVLQSRPKGWEYTVCFPDFDQNGRCRQVPGEIRFGVWAARRLG
ncbi:hypothetical protein CDD82_6578 [Ophiocordyceps australis]|uniref:BTB domain-containing protein n=1 Tax=Ophiocordyceps australis TaxID=1399860 RepID=A0A2C5XGA0_9HYPO|nr:hypothetical protein CDD82_6578 [Ophiocordyceps australis]